MWKIISLRGRIYILLAILVFITLGGGLVMIWYTSRIEGLLTKIINKDLVAFQTAESLESALVNQKGFVSYYFMDNDPKWLRQLGEYRQIFKERLEEVESMAETQAEKDAIQALTIEYNSYIKTKDQVIALYEEGKRDEGTRLHEISRMSFFRIMGLCEQYKKIYTDHIIRAKADSALQASRLRVIALIAIFFNFVLALMLVYVLINHILTPVRQLIQEADRDGVLTEKKNEISALSKTVRGLLEDVDQTHSELKKSREHLLHAEKMALVGKLAAGMAHSIRNPFTSVKMRLFSLSRITELNDEQKDDIKVISEEIRHIDNIVQNFLEFSRPPRLKMQFVSPSLVVDLAIQLLEHRLRSYDVAIKVIREHDLPEIEADPEQLKEALVNLIVNACEAMEKGGGITIKEQIVRGANGTGKIQLHLSDSGPGIPKSILHKIFQPFFSTKEEGTGLGLSIVSRIIEEHGGTIAVESEEGKGATFIICLPLKEQQIEQHHFNHRR